MSNPSNTTLLPTPVVPRLAATTVLVRDRDGALEEVLLVKRVARPGDRHGGGHVFPGGTVDAADRSCHSACDGLDDT